MFENEKKIENREHSSIQTFNEKEDLCKIFIAIKNFEEDKEMTAPKKKVGRPFKGYVEDQSKEPNVPERRSILRGFKKYFSKKEY